MYNVTIKESEGTCKSDLFKTMAENGDLESIKVKDIIGKKVTINGYAVCEIKTDDKQFTLNYISTEEYGLISTGSEFFINSVKNYFGKAKILKITEIKTKKGTTYKVIPILENDTKEDSENEEKNDLPF